MIITSFFVINEIETQNIYQDIYHNSPACKNGRLQSPIILSDEISKYDQESILTGVNYNTLNDIYLNFNSRILKVMQKNIDKPIFGNINYKKRGYLSEYVLIDIEIYYPGEHRIQEGKNIIIPEVEVKLIHKRNTQYYSTANNFRNFTEPNSYLIVSLLYKQNSEFSDNGFLTDLIKLYNPSRSPMSMRIIDFDNYKLIKNNRYYMYDGSFTYFPCDENVSHIVVKDIFDISSSNLENVLSRYKIKYTVPEINKSIAQLYGRPVLRNYILNFSFYLNLNLFSLLSVLIIILF